MTATEPATVPEPLSVAPELTITALAGIKHLNRLEQVVARAEWSDPSVAEGLLRDRAGRAICATAANLFAVVDGCLVTPDLSRCGVEGVTRAWVMARRDVQVRDLPARDLDRASELFLSSSLRGILPVARIGTRTHTIGPMTQSLQHALWQEVPALRPGSEGLA
jgi:4-amino-4-deoxychorismate lyase